MSSQKPVYVLLGGVCHTPAFMTPLIAELQKLGYDATAVAYATMGPNIETAEQWDDVRAVQDAVSHIVDEQQRDVILMLHSYGGWVGSRAVKGLDKETREKNGKKNGIMEVVFLAAFLIPDNAEIAKHAQQPEWLTFEVSTFDSISTNPAYSVTVHFKYCNSLQILTGCIRTGFASLTRKRFRISSVISSPRSKSAGSQSFELNDTISPERRLQTLLGICLYPRHTLSSQTIRPWCRRSSWGCCKVSSIVRGPSRA